MNFAPSQTPAPTAAPAGATPSPKKKVMVGALVLFLVVGAVAGGFYLFKSTGANLTPPSLELNAKVTQGFIKDAKLGFATATKADEDCFNLVAKQAKTDGEKPTTLNATATNKGMHYLYWDSSEKATFKTVGCNTNPSKAKMLFMATWDAAAEYFVTSPHEYYVKEKAGKIMTKIVDMDKWDTVNLPQSSGFIFASPGNTETYGFKDGNTFAREEYGICDKGNPKPNGWNLFASHTKDSKELFKLCADGEIMEFNVQTSVDPVRFDKVANDTTLKYSMVWVYKGNPVKTGGETKPDPETKPQDNIYTLDGKKLTVKSPDTKVVNVYTLTEKDVPTGTTISYKLSEKDKNIMIVETVGALERKAGSISFDDKQVATVVFENDFKEAYQYGYDKTSKTLSFTYLKKPVAKKNEYTISADQKTLSVNFSDGATGTFKVVETALADNLHAILDLEATDGSTKPVNVIEYNLTDQKETKIGTVAFNDKKEMVVNVLDAFKAKYSITMDPKKPGEIAVKDIVLGAPKVQYVVTEANKKELIVTFIDEKTQKYTIVESNWPISAVKETSVDFIVDKDGKVTIQETKTAPVASTATVATVTIDSAPAVETAREATATLADAFKTIYAITYDKTTNVITVKNLILPKETAVSYEIDQAKKTVTVKHPTVAAAVTYKINEAKIPEGTTLSYAVDDTKESVDINAKVGDAAAVKIGSFSYNAETKMPTVKVEDAYKDKYTMMGMSAGEINITATTAPGVPGVTSEISGNTVSLTIVDPADTGGSDIKTYNVWISLNDGTFPLVGNLPIEVIKADIDTVKGYKITLTEKGTYKIQVTAINNENHESAKTEITVTIEKDADVI